MQTCNAATHVYVLGQPLSRVMYICRLALLPILAHRGLSKINLFASTPFLDEYKLSSCTISSSIHLNVTSPLLHPHILLGTFVTNMHSSLSVGDVFNATETREMFGKTL
jgi:hypothetical protein